MEKATITVKNKIPFIEKEEKKNKNSQVCIWFIFLNKMK